MSACPERRATHPIPSNHDPRVTCHVQGASEEETAKLAAALKGAEFKVAAYKRENGKLFDGQQDAEASIAGTLTVILYP